MFFYNNILTGKMNKKYVYLKTSANLTNVIPFYLLQIDFLFPFLNYFSLYTMSLHRNKKYFFRDKIYTITSSIIYIL